MFEFRRVRYRRTSDHKLTTTKTISILDLNPPLSIIVQEPIGHMEKKRIFSLINAM